jgi:plastocyanin
MRLSSLRTPAALAAGLASLALAAPAGAAPATVTVGNDYFQGNSVTVNTGEAVTWQWKGSGHNVAFKTGPEKIAPTAFNNSGATFSHTFNTPGTYTYVCEAHSGMKGTVTVVDASGGDAPSGGAPGAGAPTPAGSSPQPVSGPAGPVTAGSAGVDAAAPALSKVAFKRGALRLRLSEASKLTIRYVHAGRHKHIVASRTVTGRAGVNKIAVRRWMRPGHYRVSILATDATGNVSQPARLKLTVRR